MKKWMLSFVMVVMMALAACTPRIYGVPEDRWETMSEQERVAAMEAYKSRQEALRQQREERARIRAMEKKAQLAREAEEARQRRMHVDAIYRGEGLYGELLRVTLKEGMLQFRGVHKPFHPVSFRIAAGEKKDVEIVSVQGRKARMTVFYDGSNLLLDEAPKSRRSTAVRLPYEDSWESGATYPHLVAKGPLEIRGVDVSVRIIGRPHRGRNDHRHRRPEAMQPSARMPQRPAVVVVKEPVRQPHPGVIVIDQRPQIKKPDVIVVQPGSKAGKPGAVIANRLPGRDEGVSRQPAQVVVRGPARHPEPAVVVVAQPHQTRAPDVVEVEPQPGGKKHGKVKTRRKHKREVAAAPPARIKVAFRKGIYTVKKRSYPLDPQTLDLSDGEIRDIAMGGRNGKLKVRVSYINGELLIDDVPGKSRRSTRLEFVPGWNEGQGYAVAASGNGLLRDLDIVVLSQ
jgi:hypothetical protein